MMGVDVVQAAPPALGIGDIGAVLIGNATIVSYVLSFACLIVGIVLIFTAVGQFNIHRQNPKLVPLINPTAYFVLGLIMLAVPFVDYFFGPEKTGSHRQNISAHQNKPQSLDTLDLDDEFELYEDD